MRVLAILCRFEPKIFPASNLAAPTISTCLFTTGSDKVGHPPAAAEPHLIFLYQGVVMRKNRPEKAPALVSVNVQNPLASAEFVITGSHKTGGFRFVVHCST